MKVVIPMYLAQLQLTHNSEPSYHLMSHKITSDHQWAAVGDEPLAIEVEVPDDFDPRPVKVAAIDEAIRDLRAEHQKALTDLIRQRSELLAISVSVEDSIPGHSVPF